MNFTITENECNALDSVRGQLNLVAGLLTAKDSDPAHYNASDLCAFMGAQVDSLKAVIVNVDERYKVECQQDAQLSLHDWLVVIQHMSGAVPPHAGQLKGITDKMNKSARVNPEMARVLDAWIGALVSRPEVAAAPAATKQKPGKRDKLASKITEAA